MGVHLEEIEIRGHIIDSLILPKVLDSICARGGSFRIRDITVGQTRNDPSSAVVEVRAADAATLDRILAQIADHGAVSTAGGDCRLERADAGGVFPDGFYSTTNQRTEIRHGDAWIPVDDQEMDCGVLVDLHGPTARCVPMTEVRAGDLIAVGHTAAFASFPNSDRESPRR